MERDCLPSSLVCLKRYTCAVWIAYYHWHLFIPSTDSNALFLVRTVELHTPLSSRPFDLLCGFLTNIALRRNAIITRIQRKISDYQDKTGEKGNGKKAMVFNSFSVF